MSFAIMSSAHPFACILLASAVVAGCSREQAAPTDSTESAAVEHGDDPSHPSWLKAIARMKPGATRAEVERRLPQGFTTAPPFGSSGMHREFYTVSNEWQVAVVYRSPDMRYQRHPSQKLLTPPRVTRVDADTRETYVDPVGSFSLRRVSTNVSADPENGEPGGAANRSQPIRSATNSTSSAAGSDR